MLKYFSPLTPLIQLFCAPQCAICQSPTADDQPLCSDCFAQIQSPEFACQICARALPSETTHPICASCLTNPPPFDRMRSLGNYEADLRQLILAAKQHKQLSAIATLRWLISTLAESRWQAPAAQDQTLICVPSTTLRLIRRGFDFPLTLITPICKDHQINLRTMWLNAPFYRHKQATLKRQARLLQPHHFRLKTVQKLPKSLILFDDIVTTGQTITEISQLLKKHGVEQVEVWCIARRQFSDL